MRYFKNFDTGEIWTREEIKKSFDAVRYELPDPNMDFDVYLENLLALGRDGVGGLVEI